MDYWTRSADRNSLDSIGVAYDDTLTSFPTDANAVERTRRVHMITPHVSSGSPQQGAHNDRDWLSLTDDLTTTDTTGFTSSSRQITGLSVHHRNDNTTGFTFSGTPADVVCFRSCISYHTHRSGRSVVVPEQTGPFSAEVLCIILLYIAVDMREILQVSHTCRFWRFYTNYAPHWTYFRRLDWGRRIKDLPNYIRKVVVKPKIVTQAEYFRERRKVQAAQRREEFMGTARHVRWCIAIAVLSAVASASNFVISYFLGFLSTVLTTDELVGGVTFTLMLVMVILEVTVVIVPLGGAASPSEKQNMMRLLSWGLFLLLTGCIFGTMSALAMSRVRSNGHILDGTEIDLTMDAECSVIDLRTEPSFAYLPAMLNDLRWRPLTMDPTEKVFIPYCISKPGESNKTMCYVFLFFDSMYVSAIFNDTSALETKDIGTRTALGFDPVGNSAGAWCAFLGRPQVVAVTELIYKRIKSERDLLYPDSIYTNAAHRPQKTDRFSYQCSVDYARVATEEPQDSTDIWYKAGRPWRQHYVPLMTNNIAARESFKENHDHFLNYASFCYIAPSILWGVMLISQCIMREHALMVLGMMTTFTLVLMNPILLLISGLLCAKLSDYFFMCDEGTGGSMVGGGIFITAFLLAIYVCFN
ncbi:uncharacterized protein TM35_000461520 [Trypanosoma theileri]|uniref:F-box domain-containing protein n=1 Tax=Trypanosoma theileri TaxID=67003 RepID=A0A1X0NIN6_9TRYP|nr:uncharacterized protein TM35_000461520 [Trypanosoma theileri]ORC84333.1 hypothetical protein TM35_000461520 [Trypanosoma theileri]